MPKAVPVRTKRGAQPMYRKYADHLQSSSHVLSRKRADSDTDNETEGVVPGDISKKILTMAKDQLEDDEESFQYSEADEQEDGPEYVEAGPELIDDDEGIQAEYSRKVKFAPEEPAFSGKNARQEARSAAETDLPEAVVEHYTRIGKFLAVYTVGKIPKGFKMLPTRKQWEELLYYTNPVEWTPHAHFQAARVFASNLNDNLAQRYFNLVLLPAVRADIKQNKKLHFQLYQALKKALFKPLAFMKGILIPLSDAPDCTLREAVIVGSVLAKMTVPMAYGAAALLKMAVDADKWTPVKSVLITMLINKKYSLPSQVVEGLTLHFVSFARVDSKMPVLWQTSFLSFVQRYKQSLTEGQRARLNDLLQVQVHPQITSEIRRELASSVMMED